MLLVTDASGRSMVLGEVGLGGRLRTGLARLPAATGARHAVWITGEEALRWRVELVREPGRRWRVAGMTTWRRPRWRAGMALTHSPGAFPEAFDPIAGQPMDRPHRALQVHGAHLFPGWRVQGLIRRIWRGFATKASIRDRAEWTLEGRGGQQSWRIRLRLDREDAGAPDVVWSARWTEETGAGRRLRVRWRVGEGGTATLLVAGLQRGQRTPWQVWVAGAGGDAASPWLTGVGGGPPLSQWLAPGGWAAVAALGRASTARWRANVWVALEADPQEGLLAQVGARIMARWRD
jgi:hypothetical protein